MISKKCRFLSLSLFLALNTSVAFADSPLSILPFGIKIGITKNQEIDGRGKCTSKIKVTESYFKCEAYDMAGGKFRVESSQNETVSKVSFSRLYSEIHDIPQSWKNLGINLHDSEESYGTSIYEFINIVLANGAQNISKRAITKYEVGYRDELSIISFDIGNNHFEAAYVKRIIRDSDNVYDKGLARIEVTEAY